MKFYIISLFAILGMICLYAFNVTIISNYPEPPFVSLNYLKMHSENFEGKILEYTGYATHINENCTKIEFEVARDRTRIITDTKISGLKSGELITVKVISRMNKGYLELLDVHIHRNLKFFYLKNLLAFFILMYVIFSERKKRWIG